MTTDSQVISVLIPTFQRVALLRRAIESVQRQTYPHVRICVFDNCSEDGTREMVLAMASEDSRIRYHRHEHNIGALANFQFGLHSVDTELWAFLSDDDVLLPGCYQAALRGFAEFPEAMYVCTRVVNEDESGRIMTNRSSSRVGLHRPPEGLLTALREGFAVWTGTVWRREITDVIGDLRNDAGGAQDTNFSARAAAHCAYVLRPEIGAVFASRSVRTETSLRPFEFLWPGQFVTVAELRADERLPHDVRELAARLLEDDQSGLLFREALRYFYWRRIDDAARCLELLRTKPRNGRRVAILSTLLGAARIRPLLEAYRWAVHARHGMRARQSMHSAVRRQLQDSGWSRISPAE